MPIKRSPLANSRAIKIINEAECPGATFFLSSAKSKKRQKGASLVELILVLALVCMFGAMLFSLIIAGSSAYTRLEESRIMENDARVAMSYLHVKLRQNDVRDGVRSVTLESGANALLLISPDGGLLQTYIFFLDGHLYESNVMAGAQPDLSVANVIADVDDCKLEYDSAAGVVRASIRFGKDEAQTLTTSVSLRSAEGGAAE